MARQSPNGRPLVGSRLNDTVALVRKGTCPPPGRYELHFSPSAEAMVTDVSAGGTRPDFSEAHDASPDRGNTMARALDHLRRR
jgi:hypothetical protein